MRTRSFSRAKHNSAASATVLLCGAMTACVLPEVALQSSNAAPSATAQLDAAPAAASGKLDADAASMMPPSVTPERAQTPADMSANMSGPAKPAAADAGASNAGSPPSCADNIKNGDESDTDCGYACRKPCRVGDKCTTNADCQSKRCNITRCDNEEVKVASCTDGERNGDETGIDCGGGCSCCPTYELKYEVRNALGFFGGDTGSMGPRSVGVATSVAVKQSGTLQRFAFYFSGALKDEQNEAMEATLVLQIRSASGAILQTSSLHTSKSLKEGFVFWEDLAFKLSAGTTYIFSAYEDNALTQRANTGCAGDANQGNSAGVGYSAAVMDSDSSFDQWSAWHEHPWDPAFWLQACQ